MRLRSVAVLGGGPGGLYAARLIKLQDPDCRIDVYEQGAPGETFGFGVGLAPGTQRILRAADAVTLDDILSHAWPHDMSLRVGDQVVALPGDNLRSIGRATLLSVLQEHAAAEGVGLHFGCRVSASDLDADLVVVADGVSSATRNADPQRFGVEVDVSQALYLWCGADLAIESALFQPEVTEHGTFVTHAYPYAPDRSTFLIETDEQTWARAGLDRAGEAIDAAESDDASLEYLQEVFIDALRGHPLRGNRTRWTRFRTVTCARWHAGNVVLLGDAAHTAHYSIGSGTKLAMEDGIALVAALGATDDLEDALTAYEIQRRPAVEHLQAVARRSERWWDSFPQRMHLPLNQLLVSYMTRAGKVSLERFADTTPSVVEPALQEYLDGASPRPIVGSLVDWVVGQPLRVDGTTLADRTSPPAGAVATVEFTEPDVWGKHADIVLDELRDRLDSGARAVRVTGPADRDSVLDRLDLAERVRLQLGSTLVVQAPPHHLPDLAAGLVAGRTDLIEMDPVVGP